MGYFTLSQLLFVVVLLATLRLFRLPQASQDSVRLRTIFELPLNSRYNCVTQLGHWERRTSMSDVTRIMSAIEQGDTRASDELLPLVYDELRVIAARKMSHEPPGQTLQATALVHEAFIRLVGAEPSSWDNRGHFFSAAAEAMRRILVENARRKQSQKRGGGYERVNLDELTISITGPSEDIIAISEALDKLAAKDPAVAELVKLHYFSGLTLDQVAQLRGIGRRTAAKYLSYARAWLRREIARTGEPRSP